MVFKKAVWSSIAALVFFVSTASAQTPSGTISGRVLDATGLSLPGVTVTLQGVDITQTYTTDGEGRYRFLELAPGILQGHLGAPGLRDARARERRARPRQDRQPAGDDGRSAASRRRLPSPPPSPIVDGRADRHGDELHRRRAGEDSDLARSVLADALGAGRARRSRQRRRQRDRPAVELRLEGHAAAGRGLDARRRRHHRHGADRVVAHLFQLRQLRRDPRHDRRPGRSRSRPAASGSTSSSSAAPTCSTAARAATSTTNRWNRRTCRPSWRRSASRRRRPTTTSSISDYGFDIGGPLLRDKAWFYGSYSVQDVQLVRRTGTLVDRTQLKNPNVKVNWQASRKDMVSFLYFDGFKIKDNRSPGTPGITLRRADGDVPPGQRLYRQSAARAVEARGRPRAQLEHVPVGEVRVLQHRLPARRPKAA